jgi:molybdate transport system substrate-binding protein
MQQIHVDRRNSVRQVSKNLQTIFGGHLSVVGVGFGWCPESKLKLMFARLLALVLLLGIPAYGAEITVAAASDLNFALREIASSFEQKTGNKVVLSFGSSGNFFSQIQNGAPYDVFMSADTAYPHTLAKTGFVDGAVVYVYARGSLVLWVPRSAKLDPRALQIKLLSDGAIKKIAIANPKHAPYGRAAEAALKSLGVYEQVAPKLVMGENVSQAAQYVESGNAQAGLIALSLALAPGMKDKGEYWQIPDSAYPPMHQAAVVLKTSRQPAVAKAFLEYLATDGARAILERHGFRAGTAAK